MVISLFSCERDGIGIHRGLKNLYRRHAGSTPAARTIGKEVNNYETSCTSYKELDRNYVACYT